MPLALEVDSEEEWEVEKILGKRKRNGRIEYLVSWLGWPDTYDKWYPAADVANAPEAIAEYEAIKPSRRSQRKKH